jgi:hypothetical protein
MERFQPVGAARPDAEDRASVRKLVDVGGCIRGLERAANERLGDSRSEPDATGRRRRDGVEDERVAVRLGDPERSKASLIGQSAEVAEGFDPGSRTGRLTP